MVRTETISFISCSFSHMLWNKARSLLEWNKILTDVPSLCKDMYNINIKKESITFNTFAVILWKFGWREITGYSKTQKRGL